MPELLWRQTIADVNQTVEIPDLFDESILILGLESDRLYYPAATLYQDFLINGVGWVFIESKTLTSGSQLVYFSNPQPYRLRLKLTVNVRFVVSIWRSEMPLNNPIRVTIPEPPSERTRVTINTEFAASITAVFIAPASVSRKGMTIFNDSPSARMFVEFDADATLLIHAFVIEPGGYYEMPFNYYGGVTAIWDAAVGNCRVRSFEE